MNSKHLLLNQYDKPKPVIPVWDRNRIINLYLHLSGLTIKTDQFGIKPWFELAYQCLTDPNDRADVRGQKKLVGDTHQILEFYTHSGFIYPEPGTWLNQCWTPSAEQNLDWFYMLCYELVIDNMIPVIVFDGDNGDNPVDGYPNALRQLPIVIQCLDNLRLNALYARFWDGVWYGSSRNSIPEFGRQFRSLMPENNACLFIEMQSGIIQLGDDVKTYGYDGYLKDYDGVCSEFDSNVHQDSTWQVAGRMLNPYHRPPDQPSWDDPNPPYYLGQGDRNPRGNYKWIPFENKAYEWVRNMVTPQQLSSERDYFRAMGATNICW